MLWLAPDVANKRSLVRTVLYTLKGFYYRSSILMVMVMSDKFMIYLGVFVGSSVGSWLGSLLDHGNFFGLWGILLGTIGAIAGIWIGYKIVSD